MTLPVDNIEPSGDLPTVATSEPATTPVDHAAPTAIASSPRPSTDEFEAAGRQIAAVLRTAEEEATRVRDQAEAEAEVIRSDARARAAELCGDAEAERAEAKVLLLRARERADQLVIDAEQRIAAAVRDAESQARTRVTTVLDAARHRLEQLARDEHEARERMLDAQAELQAVIQRIAQPLPVIDLTSDEPTVRFGLALAPVPVAVPASAPPPGGALASAPPPGGASVPAASPGETTVSAPPPGDTSVSASSSTGRRRTDQPPEASVGPATHDAVSTTDSLSTMVRGAVDRAQDTAVDHMHPTTGHPHLAALPDPDPPQPRTDEAT